MGDFTGGTISGNTASENNNDGFFVDTFSGGTFSGNTASGNGVQGFFVNTFTGGTISDNTASGNDRDGFFVVDFPGGNSAVFSNNSSTNNTLEGYNTFLGGTPFDGSTTNTGFGHGGGTDNF